MLTFTVWQSQVFSTKIGSMKVFSMKMGSMKIGSMKMWQHEDVAVTGNQHEDRHEKEEAAKNRACMEHIHSPMV